MKAKMNKLWDETDDAPESGDSDGGGSEDVGSGDAGNDTEGSDDGE
jgi:hypothetical protein